MRAFLVALPLLAACKQDYDIVHGPPQVDPGEVTDCGFTRVGDTSFYAYDCNPVFTTTGESWAPTIDTTAFAVTEVLDHPFYQLWYTGVPSADSSGDYGLGYAVSPDGTNWTPNPANPLLTTPKSGAWDKSGMDGLQVVWDPDTQQYVMLYQGYNLNSSSWGLGVATSPDGGAWTKLPTNPVLDLTTGKGKVVGWCWPLGLSLGSVVGYTGYIAGYTSDNGPCQAYPINAGDVTTWAAQTTPFFKAGKSGAWDDQGQISLATADLDGTHYLFYVGFGDWEDHQTYRTTKGQFLGMATSSDGVSWDREADPVPINQTQDGQINAVAAHTVGPRIHLWVTDEWDGQQAVGYYLFDPERAAAEDGG